MQPRLSVVVCAYTMSRWDQLVRSVDSLRTQTVPVNQIVLVIDHNPELLERCRTEFDGVDIVPSADPKGLSTARNTGISHATGSIIAFLDDDAWAKPDWAENLLAPFIDPTVMGVGGYATADWVKSRPSWFPSEFNWVVGCTYEGLPKTAVPVRNVIGCNMAFRASVFEEVGGFDPEMGRVGTHPVGCEETELCIRARHRWPDHSIIHQPTAEVLHTVSAERSKWDYFFRRCYAEGLSKARVVELVGADQGLSSERSHAFRVLPRGFFAGISDAVFRGRLGGLGRATAILTGLAATTAGFGVGWLRLRLDRRRRHVTSPTTDFEPIQMIEVELTAALPAIKRNISTTGQPYQRTQAMVRLHGRPIGTCRFDLPEQGLQPASLAAHIQRELGSDIARELAQLGATLPNEISAAGLAVRPPSDLVETGIQPISVIIATRDRPDALRRCLKSLGELDYPDFEVVVVDNAPSTGASKEVVTELAADDPRIRYVFEPKPGLAQAHNTGRSAVFSPIIAFTDDDVTVDPAWLRQIAAAFAISPSVDCVTGLIYPAELETAAQEAVESLSYGKGYEVLTFDLHEHRIDSPLFPYAAGAFGSGANMSFRTEALDRIGGFDPVLGAGARGAGGDDLAAFFDVINSGGTIVYEPSAMIYHFHDTGFERLKQQAYGYGVGLGAYLTRIIVQKPRRILEFIRLAPRGLSHFLRSGAAPESPGIPGGRTLSARRFIGVLNGPRAYLGGRRAAKQNARTA